MKVPLSALQVSRLVDGDSDRYTTDCVQLSRQGSTLSLVATDGRCIAVATWQDDSNYPDSEVLIPREIIDPHLAAPPSRERELELTSTKESVSLSSERDGYRAETTTEAVDGKFPDWRTMESINYDKQDVVSFDVDARRLIRLLDAVRKAAPDCGDQGRVAIRIDHTEGFIHVVSKDEKFTAKGVLVGLSEQ